MNALRRLYGKLQKRFVRPIIDELYRNAELSFRSDEAAAQKVLMNQYRLQAFHGRDHLPNLKDVGFRKYSQFEEDGILLYIFSLIPPINRKCVEICAAYGRQCNTANLIINHGWWGYLFDGDENHVNAGKEFFSKNKDTFLYPPRYTTAWITAENVNEVIERSGAKGAIDLLSLDVDGVDYWIWKAIAVVEPQVVVCETANPIPPDKAWTVPYDPTFVCESENYRGASLAAMCKLGKEKGYRLIGAHRFGFNAFFMKNGVGEEFFPEVTVESCVDDPYSQLARTERWPNAKLFTWYEV
ncbi:hypothetical protein [Candidatus Nitrospira salsa]